MRAIDVTRGASVAHPRYGRGIVVGDPERSLLGRLTGRVAVVFDRFVVHHGSQPIIVYTDYLTALGPTGLPLATAEMLDCGNVTPLPLPPPSPDARFGGRKIRPGLEVITGGRL